MDLLSGQSYWLYKNGVLRAYHTTLFSILAVEIITDLMQGKKNPDANIFQLDQ
ncbi:hypothetical protein [Spirosoma aerolatum]|uniref:hypothetical protein n=1 Tax=Spirosoma aerolatum TaxID=1211326 RepID=UPI0012D2A450|nr:hypothetical protein [Spirosoma aerolatum]